MEKLSSVNISGSAIQMLHSRLKLKNMLRVIFLLFWVFMLVSCGDNDSEKTITGQFIDDQVQGISYTCSTGLSGVTSSTGQFVCYEYDNVTFSLGGVTLGTIPALNTLVTPFTLFQNDFDAAINLARLLQSIDADNDPDNGKITINENLVDLLPADTDFSSLDFVSDIETALGITLVPTQQALENLTDSIVQFTQAGNLPFGDHLPLADAGSNQGVITGSTVTLDGSGSYDEDGDTLEYSWWLTRPAGSQAVIENSGSVSTTFVADIAGEYEVTLSVYDDRYTNYEKITITANDSVDVPVAPGGVQAVAGDAEVALSWNAVSNATRYTVYWDTTPAVSTVDSSFGAGSNTQFNFFSLTNGQTYYFRVSASNTTGEGPLSTEVSAIPAATGPAVPTAPQNVQATAGDAEVVLTWNAVSGASGYTVYWSTTSNVTTSDSSMSAGGTTQLTHSNLANDTTYYYRVSASNATGEGTLSTEASATPAESGPVVPTAPQNLQADAGDTEVALSWTAVDNASSYTVYWDTNSTVTTSDSSISAGSITQLTHSSLTNDTIYYYRVSAGNTAGEGALSTEVSATPVLQTTELPAQPQGFQIISGDTQLTLSWNAVINVDSYEIAWREAGINSWSFISVDGNTTQYIHTGLTNGTTYTYSVRAVNTAGDGPSTPQEIAIPAIPVPYNLEAVAGNEQTLLTWEFSDVGDFNYTVYWNTIGNVTTSDSSIDANTDLEITHLGLTAGTNYFYRVSATGASGESELSSEISSTQLSDWQWANPQPHGNNFNQIIWGNNQFIAVTDAGGIYTSSDGTTWAKQNSGTANELWDIVWNGSQYVAVGQNGVIVTSTDAVVWSVQSHGAEHSVFLDVVWNGSLFVVAGGTIMTSPDGVAWTEENHSATGFMMHLSWNGSLFVLFENYPAAYFHTSPDGITWTRHATTLSNLVDIVWDGTHFIAPSNGSVYSSTDGSNWTDLGDPGVSLVTGGIIWDGSQFVGVGQTGFIATSDDGLNWTTQTSNTTEGLRSIASNNSQYVAGGYVGRILTSPNATDWSSPLPTAAVARRTLSDIVWNGSRFVAVGGLNSSNLGANDGVIVTSPDGDTWTSRTTGGEQPILNVIWNGSQLLAVGWGSTILTSPDGVTWTSRDSGTSNKTFRDIAWDGSQFVVVGGYQVVVTSPDGIDWTSHTIDSTVPSQAVAWNGTRFVAVGGYSSGYNVMTSPDGETWTVQTKVFPRLNDVIWADNQFVAAADGRMLTSPDGLEWTTHYMLDASGHMVHVGWDGTQYVGCSAEGPIHTSPDGAIWTRQNTGSGNWLESIAWNDSGKAIGVGLFGTILTNGSW